MKIHMGSNIIFRVSEQYYMLCNFLTIDFGENLQEYFFVQNQFLIIKMNKKNYIKFPCVVGGHLGNMAAILDLRQISDVPASLFSLGRSKVQ